MMKQYTHLLLGLSLLLGACKKDDTGVTLSLPAKTQSGEHTFGFLLNTVVWTNYGQVCFPFAGGCRENLSGIYYTNDGDVHIRADKVFFKNNTWNTEESIDLYLSINFQGARTYSTLTNDTLGVAYSYAEPGLPDKVYLLSTSEPLFSIAITKIDPLLKTMSGTFSGKLFRRINDTTLETSATDSIVLSDGRFDIRLK